MADEDAFRLIRVLCTRALEGTISLENLRGRLPEVAYTHPFLKVICEDLGTGIGSTPRSRFLGRVKRRTWYHTDHYGLIWLDRLLLGNRLRHHVPDELLNYREMWNRLVGVGVSEEIVEIQLGLLEPATEDSVLLSEAAYVACRGFLIKHLREAIVAQEDGRFLDIGDGFDEYEQSLPREGGPDFDKLLAGLRFWEGWADSAEHDWHHYDPTSEEWLAMAREVADRLERDEDIPEHIVIRAL